MNPVIKYIRKNVDVKAPFKKTIYDNSYTLFFPDDQTFLPKETMLIQTGLVFLLPSEIGLIVFSYEASNFIIQTTVLPSTYTSEIVINVTNNSECMYTAMKGDELCNILFFFVYNILPVEMSNVLHVTETFNKLNI